MEAKKLIISLCDMTEDLNKFVQMNDRDDSLVDYMEDFTIGYRLICGDPTPCHLYLLVDMPLNGLVPELMFEHKDAKASQYFYGYRIDEE